MPDVLFISYLLFAISTASVLAGEVRDLPWVALSSMLLIHSHVAQILFTGLIGGGSILLLFLRQMRAGKLAALWAEQRRYILWAAAICAVFLAPPVLDFVLHKPNKLMMC